MSKLALLAALLATASACGKTHPPPAHDAAPATASKTPDAGPTIAPRPLGLPSIAAYQYAYGKGAKDYKRAQDAYKSKDWATVQSACEATLAADPDHLEAHRLLASALAQKDAFAAASEHLGIVLAADWIRFAGEVDQDADLARLLASPWGAQVKQLSASYRTAYLATVKQGLLLLGRRSPFKPPAGQGAQYAVTGAELYAYDTAGKRYLRVTRSNSAVAAFARAPSGDELAYVAWSKVNLAADAPAMLVDPRIGIVNLVSPEAPVVEAKFKNLRGLGLHYETGDKLVATTYIARGPGNLARAVDYEVDKATGKTKSGAFLVMPEVVVVTYDHVDRTPTVSDGIAADWGEDSAGAASFTVLASNKQVTLPVGERAAHTGFSWSPAKTRLAFVTLADPCASDRKQRQASLYLVDVASGTLKHLTRGEAELRTLWLDDDRLVYEDAEGALHIYQAGQALELERLTSRGGLALLGLGASARPLCKGEAPEEQASEELDWSKESLGPLHSGLAGGEVEGLLGAPDKKPALQEEGATGDWVAEWSWKKKGVSLIMTAGDKAQVPSVRALTISRPCSFRTGRGIGVGSTREEVIAAYGAYQAVDDATDPDVFVAGSMYGGVIFRFRDDRVASIFIGAAAE